MNPFYLAFGHSPEVSVQAPGRVNLIGEHTDYNGGFVLPTPIPQSTRVELATREDQKVLLLSSSISTANSTAEYVLGQEYKTRQWSDYIRGVTKILKSEGYPIRGFEAHISSDVPMGSGLSSSAALEVATFRALREAFQLKITDLEIAKLSQRVENEFVGARVGIMDQMVSSLGEPGFALFIDTLDLSSKKIPLPAAASLLVINSGVSHSNAHGDYNTRRAECESACRKLSISLLRETSLERLSQPHTLSEIETKRARHVLTENARVLQALELFSDGDLAQIGELFYASHLSMKNDYEVSIPEIDLLVELAMGEKSVYGARLTGGGFGGSIVALAQAGTGRETAARITEAYAKRSGRKPTILLS